MFCASIGPSCTLAGVDCANAALVHVAISTVAVKNFGTSCDIKASLPSEVKPEFCETCYKKAITDRDQKYKIPIVKNKNIKIIITCIALYVTQTTDQSKQLSKPSWQSRQRINEPPNELS
jgi:hypothetical protein